MKYNGNMSCADISLPKVTRKPKTRRTQKAVDKLMAILQVPQYIHEGQVRKVNRTVADGLLFLRYTGCRSIEARKLKWDDVDFERRTIVLRDPKGGVDAVIPMSEKARRVLLKRIPVGFSEDNPPLPTTFVFPDKNGNMIRSFYNCARQYSMHAGMPEGWQPCHGLRFLFASELNDKGVQLTHIQRLLTHKDVSTTMHYAEVDADSLRDAANLIN